MWTSKDLVFTYHSVHDVSPCVPPPSLQKQVPTAGMEQVLRYVYVTSDLVTVANFTTLTNKFPNIKSDPIPVRDCEATDFSSYLSQDSNAFHCVQLPP